MESQLKNNSYLYGGNSIYIEELYESYLKDQNSVDSSWQKFFLDNGDNFKSFTKRSAKIVGINDDQPQAKPAVPVKEKQEMFAKEDKEARAHMLLRAYRVRGHFLADLDPLQLEDKKTEEDLYLDANYYGFSSEDLDKEIYLGTEIEGVEKLTLRQLVSHLHKIYCGHIGLEFMHIQDLGQKEWLQDKMESLVLAPQFNNEEKKQILKDIIEVEQFEKFLHVKFPGTKRFSVEGGENSVVALENIINHAHKFSVQEVILGMAHRGRLNVLTKAMGKPYHSMLSEFQGNLAFPDDMDISGDVKYHLGTSSDRVFADGKSIHLSLTPNPSHLEAVNPVVAGKVRAKQDSIKDANRTKVLGILIHGDAAFAGQGVVAETLSLGDLTGYTTGGTIHIIVNNQIGFTTSPKNARLSRYPTEVAKIVQAPIFHVNGDDPEAVASVAKIALEYQQKFKKDVVIDIFCYRLHGHNETDEPAFTQPVMYKAISQHQSPSLIYAERLQAENVINEAEYKQMIEDFKSFLTAELDISKTFKPKKADWLEGKWQGMKPVTDYEVVTEETGVDLHHLIELGKKLTQYPSDFNINLKIRRQLEAKLKMLETGRDFDWAMGEALAFATLLDEGTRVRLSGQDCERGTFSHRHAVLVDQMTDKKYTPLKNISEKQGDFEVINSNLSEFAVLGFEYGYSHVDPNALIIWEAQFGDFANGAQVVVDQFLSSAENKWLRMSGLVMLLPHGYEGQGPEHSSARLERYLQLCAENNMQVVNPTTPASLFHAFRRQIHRSFRKPLIIMSPKSLLRHKLVLSNIEDFASGSKFKPVIGEAAAVQDVKRVIICSGKVYYDLFEEREQRGIKNIAIIRTEQYYPFPASYLKEELSKYPNAEIIWCQEEHENMGAWSFMSFRINNLLLEMGINDKVRYIGRKEAASPAVGYAKIHEKEQKALINDALTV